MGSAASFCGNSEIVATKPSKTKQNPLETSLNPLALIETKLNKSFKIDKPNLFKIADEYTYTGVFGAEILNLIDPNIPDVRFHTLNYELYSRLGFLLGKDIVKHVRIENDGDYLGVYEFTYDREDLDELGLEEGYYVGPNEDSERKNVLWIYASTKPKY